MLWSDNDINYQLVDDAIAFALKGKMTTWPLSFEFTDALEKLFRNNTPEQIEVVRQLGYAEIDSIRASFPHYKSAALSQK